MSTGVPAVLSALIGVTKFRRVAVTERDIRRFADATGHELVEPVKGKCLVAPPLFYQTMTYEELPVDKLPLDGSPIEIDVPIPAQRTVGGGSCYEVFRYARAGDMVTVASRLNAVRTKEGRSGLLYFIDVETEFRDEDGVLMAREVATYIKRI